MQAVICLVQASIYCKRRVSQFMRVSTLRHILACSLQRAEHSRGSRWKVRSGATSSRQCRLALALR